MRSAARTWGNGRSSHAPTVFGPRSECFGRSPGRATLTVAVDAESWIAIVPILLMVPFMVRRILIEERMIASAPPGYANYTQRVRSRIVPGIVVSACMGRHA